MTSLTNPGLWFTGPGEVEIRDMPIPAPAAGEVLIRARRSLISTGTELTLLRGRARPGSVWHEIGRYPRQSGYSHVGEVVEVGPGVTRDWLGKRVKTQCPHAAWVSWPEEQLRRVPEEVSDEEATFATLGEVTMNGLRRVGLTWGESVAVFGLGVVGQLAVRLAVAAGAGPVFAVELAELRLARLPRQARVYGLKSSGIRELRAAVEKENDGRRVDVVIETTAEPSLIPDEVRLLRDQGRMLMLSSPRGQTSFDFHDLCNRQSLAIIGAHGFSHPPVETLDHPWTGRRHGELFLQWLAAGRLSVTELVTHRFPIAEAAEAYTLLDQRRAEALGVIFVWPGS